MLVLYIKRHVSTFHRFSLVFICFYFFVDARLAATKQFSYVGRRNRRAVSTCFFVLFFSQRGQVDGQVERRYRRAPRTYSPYGAFFFSVLFLFSF